MSDIPNIERRIADMLKEVVREHSPQAAWDLLNKAAAKIEMTVMVQDKKALGRPPGAQNESLTEERKLAASILHELANSPESDGLKPAEIMRKAAERVSVRLEEDRLKKAAPHQKDAERLDHQAGIATILRRMKRDQARSEVKHFVGLIDLFELYEAIYDSELDDDVDDGWDPGIATRVTYGPAKPSFEMWSAEHKRQIEQEYPLMPHGISQEAWDELRYEHGITIGIRPPVDE